MIFRLAAILAVSGTVPAAADIVDAKYAGRTSIYGHEVVPGGEYGALEIQLDDGRIMGVSPIPEMAVFEDTSPRLVDVDGDGSPEIITVISYLQQGAAIRIWDESPVLDDPSIPPLKVLAEGEPIGTRFRWLAIVGAADLDGDGSIEIAYVDRPHLAKTLRIVNIDGDSLVEKASAGGVTNHRIGEADIAGGIRDCGNGPEMLMASADWSNMLAVTYDGSEISARSIGEDTSRPAFARALACDAP